jgi:hypothetical protein
MARSVVSPFRESLTVLLAMTREVSAAMTLIIAVASTG